MTNDFETRVTAALRECNLHGFNQISCLRFDYAREFEVVLLNGDAPPIRSVPFKMIRFRLADGEMQFAEQAPDATLVRFIKAKLAVLYLMVGIEGRP